jgi:hypothetical protein
MKQQRTEQEKLHLLVLTGLFAGLICLFTAYICHIPECKKMIPDTRMTVVDVLPPDQIEASRKVAESCGIKLRVRHFA